MSIKNRRVPDFLNLIKTYHTRKKSDQQSEDSGGCGEDGERNEKHQIQFTQDGAGPSTELPSDLINKFVVEEVSCTKGRQLGHGKLVDADGMPVGVDLNQGFGFSHQERDELVNLRHNFEENKAEL